VLGAGGDVTTCVSGLGGRKQTHKKWGEKEEGGEEKW